MLELAIEIPTEMLMILVKKRSTTQKLQSKSPCFWAETRHIFILSIFGKCAGVPFGTYAHVSDATNGEQRIIFLRIHSVL